MVRQSNCLISSTFVLVTITVSLFFPVSVNAKERNKISFNERADKLVKAGKISQAIQIWQKQAEIYKDEKNLNEEAESLFVVAKLYNKLGNFDLAIDKLNYIISLGMNKPRFNALVWEKLGNSFQGKGEYEKAISAYQKSLKIHNSLSCLNNLVKTWIVLIERTISELDIFINTCYKH